VLDWFKNNKRELNVSYVPIEAITWLKVSAPHRMTEVVEDKPFPFFVRLLEQPFDDWVIEIVGTHETAKNFSFQTVISSVPKDVSDDEVARLQKKLKRLLSRVVNDIMAGAIENAENEAKIQKA